MTMREEKMDYIISTKDITKTYHKRNVVDHLNINIKPGSIYALIGQNGAGKTTFMKMLTGLILPDAGNISLFGGAYSNRVSYMDGRKMGSLIENTGLMMNMTAYENIKAKCICIGIKDETHIKNLLESVSLNQEKNKKVKNYSLGMKQRLGIALAMVGNPELIILDEPINGLDPQGIAFVRKLIKKLHENKITIVISSHILAEVEKIATTYGFINKGRLLEELSLQELEEKCNSMGMTLEAYYLSLVGGSI